MQMDELLGFAVVGALVTTVGSLIALFLKDFVFSRSFENWKSRRALESIFDQYRRPICFVGKELSGRCYDFGNTTKWSEENTGINLIEGDSELGTATNLAANPYFRYKLLSNAYRLCSFFGWVELYRRDLGLIDAGQRSDTNQLEDVIEEIRSDIADGQKILIHEDWKNWKDHIIFREQQRAIAHRMISEDGRRIIDFGTFCERIEGGNDASSDATWFLMAVKFYSDLRQSNDFRRTRMKRLVVHLTQLRLFLQPNSVMESHIEGANKLANELGIEFR